jgi:signal transduction histidine kinase
MDPNRPRDTSERAGTDESLRKERDKSDEEVDRRLGRASGVADAVLEQARDNADELLRAEREAEGSAPNEIQSRARGEADAATQRQRAAADEKLNEERRERTRGLAALFALEREITDQHLLAERNRADLALNHRDDFLAMVAHDLRGFMGDIALGAGVLVRSAGKDELGMRAIRIGHGIQRATVGMKRLVGDLLDIAAIEAGRLHVEVVKEDVASVLRDAAEPFRSAAESKGISLDFIHANGAVWAVFDRDRIIQILGNLVSNAIKFTPRGGTITLRLEVAGKDVTVTVTDSGSGMEPGRVEHIFERFTQLTPMDRRGLGLGLYIARCLVEAQGGRIWATTEPGRGSSFSFTLPLAP